MQKTDRIEALHGFDPTDPVELASLAELNELYGCETKARESYAWAKNKRMVTDSSITAQPGRTAYGETLSFRNDDLRIVLG